ncbi:concanavalin A-like lectin/glucanase domain-containing protein [Phyllosticta citriasiana]|uniref:concanavalin A-like lectin/glucanase domain-containing protein n=1 Tax=Phyllosticta citriasiana TaxID=595635 RepID=UPI0030FDD556
MRGAWAAALVAALLAWPLAVVADDEETDTMCSPESAVNTTSLRYTILSNQWGNDGSGLQCVTSELGSKDDNATAFNATWRWFGNRTEVHSFPSVILNSNVMPVVVSNLTSITIDASWAIVPSPSDDTETNSTLLASLDTVADVALDMFLDDDPLKSSNASGATTEVMVWQSAYGNLKPLGWDTISADPPIRELSAVNYTLYKGYNANGQTVYSWVPNQNQTKLSTDLYPLVDYLVKDGSISDKMYLGRLQFGSETMHSAENQNISFIVSHLEMNVNHEVWTPPKNSGSGSGHHKGAASSLQPSIALTMAIVLFLVA